MPASELILLVNDIPDHVSSYTSALSRHGFQVEIARSGEEALRLARTSLPHCAIIDLRLADMSGWELCRQMKKRHDQIPIIVLTPVVSRTSARDSKQVGCNAWLAHPTMGDDLARTVRHVLDLHTAAPKSLDDALFGLKACPACDSNEVRSTLRVGLVQYYCCKSCGFCWRVEAVSPNP